MLDKRGCFPGALRRESSFLDSAEMNASGGEISVQETESEPEYGYSNNVVAFRRTQYTWVGVLRTLHLNR